MKPKDEPDQHDTNIPISLKPLTKPNILPSHKEEKETAPSPSSKQPPQNQNRETKKPTITNYQWSPNPTNLNHANPVPVPEPPFPSGLPAIQQVTSSSENEAWMYVCSLLPSVECLVKCQWNDVHVV